MGFFKRHSLWKVSWSSIVLVYLRGWGWVWAERRGVAGGEGLPLASRVMPCEIRLCFKIGKYVVYMRKQQQQKKKLVLLCCSSKKIYRQGMYMVWEQSERCCCGSVVPACLMWSINCYKNYVTFATLIFLTSVFIQTCPSTSFARIEARLQGDRCGVSQQWAQGCAQRTASEAALKGNSLGSKGRSRLRRRWP